MTRATTREANDRLICLDTCVCIQFLRGSMPRVREMLQHCDPEFVKIPAVVEAELLLGAQKSAHQNENRSRVKLFLAPFEIVGFDSACAEEYALIRAELENRGLPIGPNDLMIAATARALGATLATDNVDEFGRVPGLKLESWREVAL